MSVTPDKERSPVVMPPTPSAFGADFAAKQAKIHAKSGITTTPREGGAVKPAKTAAYGA